MSFKFATAFSILASVALTACESDGGAVQQTSGDRASNATLSNSGLLPENLILRASDPDCASYAGTYETSATDLSTGRAFTGRLRITSDAGACTFQTDQIPNHDVGRGARWPNTFSDVSQTLKVSRNPAIAARPTPLSLGANAILLNGIKWEALPAACFGVGRGPLGREKIGCSPRMIDHPWRYNIGSPINDTFQLDDHHAHVQRTGLYHYHSTPRVLYTDQLDLSKATQCGSESSPVIGFASDGFPLYGPCFKDSNGSVRLAQSSYRLKSGKRQDIAGYQTPYRTGDVKSDNYDGQFTGDFEYIDTSGDLDQCNGMTVNGQYGYYVTLGYPYAMGCVSGQPSTVFP